VIILKIVFFEKEMKKDAFENIISVDNN